MEKTIENFPGSPKYDAKHWANRGCKKQGAKHTLDLFFRVTNQPMFLKQK